MLTHEQLEQRKKFIGGSDIAIVMGHSPYKTPQRLWEEKTGKVEAEDISLMPHVLRGTTYEPIAREEAERHYACKFPPVLKMHPEYSFIGANLDGLSEDGIVLEIKCMGLANHIEASLGNIPYHYMLQLQYQMMIVGTNKGILCSYRPEDESIHYVEVEADKKLWEEMTMAAKNFWQHVVDDTPLTYFDNDFVDEITEWKMRKEALENAKTAFEVLDESIKAKFAAMGAKSASIGGVTMTMVERKGNVDYKKIPELKGVDLEPYRGPTTTYVKIS